MRNRDLHISGAGSYPGGEFDSVSISGSGKINGDIRCKSFSGSGASKVVGNVVCERFSCSGSGKVTGNVEGLEIKASGCCKIEGDVKGGSLSVSGATKIVGSVKGEIVCGSGALSVGKNIEAEEVRIDGSIKNEGTINAEKVIIECRSGNGTCSFNEIGASTVSINGYSETSRPYLYKLFGMFTGGSMEGITGNLIEGDTIYVANAKVDTIRGEHITLGPNAEVRCVEYTQEIKVSETAIVKDIIKL
ncbi:MAG: polymer-forming cytoskeletal protein [Zhenhengia sp.]|uniref:Polymer-forming cytoskeletal protein n=1 Tax=Zhenhengia yiwuensis TaxID=2763666 RepID=A0A926EGW8_9FIRM|nr:polymer-forming cytoskeletal protein [Zhenhengia yiwuensis]MBC8578027.1 polymer-forming cytoskeletal protein [Zhenhengia yiwuensis]MBS5799020.1 polymer-forming cytoskeletal protein [Clostridiales bacterium]